MYDKIIHFLLILFLLALSDIACAKIDYLKHTFINDTPNEYYVIIRQKNLYPIDSCLGTIAPHSIKTCEGSSISTEPHFFLTLINKNVQPDFDEVDGDVFVLTHDRQTLITWNLKLDNNNKLKISYNSRYF